MADDYMSEDFLQVAPETTETLSYSEKRKKQLLKSKELGIVQSRKELEKSTLQKGLETEIDEENVGFKLLSKMGYKKGMSLGRMPDAITEPVPITLKSDKLGIGSMTNKKRKSEQIEQVEEIDPDEFRNKFNAKQAEKQNAMDVSKAQNVVEQLDMEHEKPMHEFWPLRKVKNEQGEWEDPPPRDFDLLPTEFKLKQLIQYLRSQYKYCLYCGIRFQNDDEMEIECPGLYRDVHDS